MAISQADFYAFSQATGAPVPEDPEARARIAPQVMEWRRNQLKQPAQQEEGPNLVQTIGGLAAAAGVGTLAFLGGKRLAGAMAARRGVSPVNVTVQDDVVRRAAQPVPQLRGVTQQSGAQTARPPIPRPPAQPTPVVVRDVTPASAPPRGKTGPGIVDPWSGPAPTSYRGPLFESAVDTKNLLNQINSFVSAKGRYPETDLEFQQYLNYDQRLSRALPAAEEEFIAYRPDPKENVAPQVADARRQAATEGLLQAAAARRGTFQPEIPGVKATLMELRAPAAVSAEEAGELVAQAESRPLSAAPAQQNLFKYVQQAAEPEGDVVDRLLTEYNQLVERQARADQRAQSSVREYQMEVQGKALRLMDELRGESLVQKQQTRQGFNVDQALNALESGEDQATGRVRQQLQRNEDLDIGTIDRVEDQTNNINVAASLTPDGVPADQAQGLTAFDLKKKESFRITPRALSQGETGDQLESLLREARLAREVDTDYDYSAENLRQTAQVRDRIERATALRDQADQILAEIRSESPIDMRQADPKAFAETFNKQYREELNDQLRSVDNARQRAELAATESNEIAQDLESLLVGEHSPVDENMRGGALRGGKPNITGDIIYQTETGAFASADTGLKTRQEQGEKFRAKAERLNRIRRSSDEELTYLIAQNQQARANNQPITLSDILDAYNTDDWLKSDTARMASEVLRTRAINNPEPTRLQLDALERARASVDATQRILQESRSLRPTLAPGPAQDVARSMETIRRGMVVEPSEPIPAYPSVQQLRTGYVSETEGDIGPILGASDVYTGAAAEAAGPVIFTGKSKAESAIQGPKVIGTVQTPVGKFLTQDNPDVLGTVYNVAGTPTNRQIAAQVEGNAQQFLANAIAGGLTAKAVPQVESYQTPGTYGTIQFNVLTPPISQKGLLPLQQSLGLTGPEASQRTHYAQYQPGRSLPAPLSPFIGEMSGGTVIATPQTTELPINRRDTSAPARSIDLTRRGSKSRYYNDDPAYPTYVTNLEPAPIGPLTQSPGLSRIGGLYETPVLGAGNVPILELTTRGQKISYPRMAKAAEVPSYKGYYQGSFYGPQGTVTNVPRYGIDPGGEWTQDLMRSAYRRGGPIKTYQA